MVPRAETAIWFGTVAVSLALMGRKFVDFLEYTLSNLSAGFAGRPTHFCPPGNLPIFAQTPRRAADRLA
jgi:hypothetical protein